MILYQDKLHITLFLDITKCKNFANCFRNLHVLKFIEKKCCNLFTIVITI